MLCRVKSKMDPNGYDSTSNGPRKATNGTRAETNGHDCEELFSTGVGGVFTHSSNADLGIRIERPSRL